MPASIEDAAHNTEARAEAQHLLRRRLLCHPPPLSSYACASRSNISSTGDGGKPASASVIQAVPIERGLPAVLMGRAQSAAAASASASVAAVTVSLFQASATASAAAPTAIEPPAWTPMTGEAAWQGVRCRAAWFGCGEAGVPTVVVLRPAPELSSDGSVRRRTPPVSMSGLENDGLREHAFVGKPPSKGQGWAAMWRCHA